MPTSPLPSWYHGRCGIPPWTAFFRTMDRPETFPKSPVEMAHEGGVSLVPWMPPLNPQVTAIAGPGKRKNGIGHGFLFFRKNPERFGRYAKSTGRIFVKPPFRAGIRQITQYRLPSPQKTGIDTDGKLWDNPL